jgi:hypothetical protein
MSRFCCRADLQPATGGWCLLQLAGPQPAAEGRARSASPRSHTILIRPMSLTAHLRAPTVFLLKPEILGGFAELARRAGLVVVRIRERPSYL